MTIKCIICDVEFKPKYKNNKFCSRECVAIFNKKQRSIIQTYYCEICGKEFLPKEADRTKCCSRECGFEWLRQNINKKNEHIKIPNVNKCVICGDNFEGRKGIKCCSNKCKIKYTKQTAKEKYIKHDHIGICFICNKIFIIDKAKGRIKTCSNECNMQRKKDINYNHKKKRRLLLKNQYSSHVNRNEIYKRDNYICQICGLLVDIKADSTHDLSPNIDHIIPLSLGGTHEPCNVQLTHRKCNLDKGTQIIRYKM